MKEDERLAKLRFDLVPKKIPEDTFWRNYLYRVARVEQEYRMSVSSKNDEKQKKSEREKDANEKKEERNEKEEVTTEEKGQESQHQEESKESSKEDDSLMKELEALAGSEGVQSDPVPDAGSSEEWEKDFEKELEQL